MFPVLHCDIPDHASCFTVLGPVSVSALRCQTANMRPAPLLAWPRSGDTLPPILALASLTNPQPCCLINHCTVETVDVGTVQWKVCRQCGTPSSVYCHSRGSGSGSVVACVTSRNCVKTFGHNNFSFQGNIDVERAL